MKRFNAGGAAPNSNGAASGALYSSDELLSRANSWASQRGYPLVTAATFKELRRDQVLPRPKRVGRGIGGGRGAAWGWSATAYLRLLRVIRLRGTGVTGRGEQRVHLFLRGANFRGSLIRGDLRRHYVRDAKRIARQYGLETLADPVRTPRKIKAEARLLVNPNMVEGFLATAGVQFPADIADGLREVFSSPAAGRIIEIILTQSVLPDADRVIPEIRRELSRLPARAASVIGGELEDSVRTLAGQLAHPDSGNAIVESLDRLSDDDIAMVRDYVIGWPKMMRGLKELVATMADDPDALMLSAAADLVSHLTDSLFLKDGPALLGFFIARTAAVPRFMETVRVSIRMRPGPVLHELARRGVRTRSPDNTEMESVLMAAGVMRDHWHYWIDPPAPQK